MRSLLIYSLTIYISQLGKCAALSALPSTGLRLPLHKKTTSKQLPINARRKRQSGLVTDPIVYDNFWGLWFANVTIGGQAQEMLLSSVDADTYVLDSNLTVCQGADSQCTQGVYNPANSTTFYNLTNFPVYDYSSYDYPYNYVQTGYYFQDTLSFHGITLNNMTMALLNAYNGSNTVPSLGLAPRDSESYSYEQGVERSYPPFLNVLKTAGYIDSMSYSLWVSQHSLIRPDLPTHAYDQEAGTLLLGGVDESAYVQDTLQVFPMLNDPQYYNDIDYLAINLYTVTPWYNNTSPNTDAADNGIPAVLDTTTWYTGLPSSMTGPIFSTFNVTYNETNGPIVDCGINNPNMSSYVYFNFAGIDNGNDNVIGGTTGGFSVPLASLLYPMYNDKNDIVKFPNGSNVCLFGIDTYNGTQYSAQIGGAVLRYLYLVVDYESSQIGLAQPIPANQTTSSSKPVTISASGGIGAGAATPTPPGGVQTSTSVQTQQVTLSQTHSATVTLTASPSPSSGAAVTQFTLGGVRKWWMGMTTLGVLLFVLDVI